MEWWMWPVLAYGLVLYAGSVFIAAIVIESMVWQDQQGRLRWYHFAAAILVLLVAAAVLGPFFPAGEDPCFDGVWRC